MTDLVLRLMGGITLSTILVFCWYVYGGMSRDDTIDWPSDRFE